MNNAAEKIIVVEADATNRETLLKILGAAGYNSVAFSNFQEGLETLREQGTDLLLLGAVASGPADPIASSVRETLSTIRGSAATDRLRVIALVGPQAEQRAASLEFGADDAISEPWDPEELLARVRNQLRARRTDNELLTKMRIAEEGQQIAHTAFDALAVTEKMASDASLLDRRLTTGLIAFFGLALMMAAIYFLFVRTAQKQTLRTNIVIAGLEGRLVRQQNMIAEVRRLRGRQNPVAGSPIQQSNELQQHAAALKAKMANADSDQVAALQKELDETDARLKHIEEQGNSAENLIRADVDSVCLLHVSVAFRNQQSGQRLRYAGLNQQGDPLQDSQGNPILTLEGHGPEVKLDIFGTGFLVGPAGRLITNRHVAEPWWKNDDLKEITGQGFQAEISEIRAYFPGDARAFSAEIQNISQDTDLATMLVDMKDLKRAVLTLDTAPTGAVTGEPIVLMGYATGLAAILARTDEDTAHQILTSTGGDVSQVLDDLARKNLIRPIITQGHIGDVLPDKIVFDAQTTSGGSGGPLFNREGKVIGVTYAVLEGFGGSNFGIPISLSKPLLAPQSGGN
jgi:DNA-binding response OmpR family regulator